jgi:5-dehydro-4-deoxyglucarate dehydratase
MSQLRGIVGFPLVPFHDDLSLNLTALEPAVDSLASHPFCAINAPAGISEAFSLTTAEAVDIARVTVQTVSGRMPVIGCVAGGWPTARDWARGMEQAGVDALLVLPPIYANAPFEGLLAYYRSIGEATGLPLALYSRGWASFSPDQVARLAEAVPTLQYWKDGQGDARAYRRIMLAVGDRLQWIGGAGDDNAAAYAAVGIECFTSSISAVAPRLAMDWGEAAMTPDFGRLRDLLGKYVHPLFEIRSRKRGYEIAAMKKLQEWIGPSFGIGRPPLPELSPADEADLQVVYESWSRYLSD